MSGLLRSLMTKPVAGPTVDLRRKEWTPSLGNNLLSNTLRMADGALEEHRSPGWIHVSNLINFCPRKAALVERHQLDLSKAATASMRIVWAMGREAERHIRKQLLLAWDYKYVIGRWACYCGDLVYDGFHDKGRSCGRCRNPAINYHEFDLEDPLLKVKGHPDLLLFLDGEVVPVEIKSVKAKPPASTPKDNKNFECLSKPGATPLPDHVFQLGSYRKMLFDRKTMPISKRGIVLYASKDYGFKSPYLEFEVDVTQGTTHTLIENAFSLVRDLRERQKANLIPDRLAVCTSPDATFAKNCEACLSCFSV